MSQTAGKLFICLILFFFLKPNLLAKKLLNLQVDGITQKSRSLYQKPFTEIKLRSEHQNQGVLYRLGKPQIPVLRYLIKTHKPELIQVEVPKSSPHNMERGMLEFDLIPNQASRIKIPKTPYTFTQDKDFYLKNQFYPKNIYSIQKAGSVKGIPQYLLTIHPFIYNPATREFILIRQLQITFKEQSPRNNLPKAMAFIVGAQFKNSPALSRYLAFKKARGYIIHTINIEDQTRSPDEIRGALQNLLKNEAFDLEAALIIGDAEDVPGYPAKFISGITDHYYRAIDTDDYVSDINGPDIGVGRLPAQNETELKVILNKLMEYQKGHFASSSWLQNPTFIATDDLHEIAEGTHNSVINDFLKNKEYFGTFPDSPNEGGDQLYAITYGAGTEDGIQRLNEERFIINYSGHGSTSAWVGPYIDQEHVRSLTSKSYSFVISNACITGQFTENESFAETWIKQPYGAVVFWGSMDNTYWDEDDILEKAMFQGIYEKDFSKYHEITQFALTSHWIHYGGDGYSRYYWETYVTFGDPTSHFRYQIPKEVKIYGPDVVTLAEDDVTFQVTDSTGAPLKNAEAVLTIKGQDFSSWGLSDENGKLSLGLFSGYVGEDYHISITGPNLKETHTSLKVLPPHFTFFKLKEFTLNGRPTLGIYPFEEGIVGFELQNMATVATEGGTLTLTHIDGPATLLQNQMEIPAMQAGETISFRNSPIKIKAQNPKSLQPIVLHFTWQSKEDTSRSIRLPIHLWRAEAAISQIDFGGLDNPSEGGYYPGATGPIYLTLSNNGKEALSYPSFTLQKGTCISKVEGEINLDLLTPGSSKRLTNPIYVTLSPSCQNTDEASIQLQTVYQSKVEEITISSRGQFQVGKRGRTLHTEEPNLLIPDKTVTLYPFELSGISHITHIQVHLKIAHEYVSDMKITLIHPNGTRVVLRNREWSEDEYMDQVYGWGGLPIDGLKNLINLSSQGTWHLEVDDQVIYQGGVLEYIQVKLFGYMDTPK